MAGTGKQLDVGTLVGVVAGLGLVYYAIQLGGNHKTFLDAQAALIVLGGTFGATLVNYPITEIVRSVGLLSNTLFPDRAPMQERISRLLHYARRLRTEPLQQVSSEFNEEPDPFFRKCLELLAEKVDEQEIRKVMSIELSFLEDRHRKGAQLFQTMGTLAPAMGLVGTLIGLIQMLQNLETPSQIGPAMAVALISTFYGALLANLFFLPLAGKLRSRSDEEFVLKELSIEGVRALAQGVNPRAIERRLLGFLPTDRRVSEYE